MLKFLRSVLSERTDAGETAPSAEPPPEVITSGSSQFRLSDHLTDDVNFPILDWDAAQAWVDAIPDAQDKAEAWARLEHAWLLHMQATVGPDYSLRQNESAFLLSTLDRNVATATLAFMSRTLQRVERVLDGIAHVPEWGKDILIVFDDEEGYYRYVSQYYPSEGEFAASGGMYINSGCGHFATMKSDLRAIEPVIAHEMTHGCLSHLPIPAWLNEGLAVNTEQRLCGTLPPLFTPREMHEKHRAFWGDAEIQQFWSGKSFLRNDDGNMLSYDLARIMVSQMSADWASFQRFVQNADSQDAGAAAASEYLDLELGAVASVLLEREPTAHWSPDPTAWPGAPERGAFQGWCS